MSDYMTHPEEQEKHPNAEEVFYAIASKRADPVQRQQVFDALKAFWNLAHAWDDLVDESDWPMAKKHLAWKALQQFVQNLLLNPFIFNSAIGIETMLTNAIARQVDADVMEKNGADERTLSAVRCADVDVIIHLARLAGGWDGMRAAGDLVRFYDKPEATNRMQNLDPAWVKMEATRVQ